MSVLHSCLFCQHFENYNHEHYTGLCHDIIQYDSSGNLIDVEPKNVHTYDTCQKFLSIYDAKMHCKNKFSKIYEKEIQWETCLMCSFYMKCWEPSIYLV